MTKFLLFDKNQIGILIEDQVFDISSLTDPPYKNLIDLIKRYSEFKEKINFDNLGGGKELKKVKILPPIQNPSKIICLGLNYASHAAEEGKEVPSEPILFFKPPSAIIAHNDEIVYPEISEHVDHEIELAFIIGKRGRFIEESKAYEHIFGYTILLDITARDLQRKDFTLLRGKGFDTFAPTGPWIVTKDEIKNPHQLSIKLWVNEEIRHDGNTKEMVFKIPFLVHSISQVMTLEPGDLIATGTPAGIGPLNRGDQIKSWIEGIGYLENKVV